MSEEFEPRAIDSVLEHWHELWKDVLNSKENRQYFAGRACKQVTMAQSRWRLRVGDRGTIRDDFEGLDDSVHYMAFVVLPSLRMHVFDPAGPGSPFYDRGLLDRIQSKVRYDVYLDPRSPQRSTKDSFCQTWSLAWLIGGDFETIINRCSAEMDDALNAVERHKVEFAALAEIVRKLIDYPNPPEFKDQWEALKKDIRLVLVNFDKFRVTAADYRADRGVRRRLVL